MPPKTPRQQRFFGAELARERAGKKTKTGLSEEKLREHAMASHPQNPQGTHRSRQEEPRLSAAPSSIERGRSAVLRAPARQSLRKKRLAKRAQTVVKGAKRKMVPAFLKRATRRLPARRAVEER